MHRLAQQAGRVGPYPDQLDSTLGTPGIRSRRRGATVASRHATRRPTRLRAITSACPTRTRTTAKQLGSALGRGRAALVHPRRHRPRTLRPLAQPRPHTAAAATHRDEDQPDAASANGHAGRRQRRGHRAADKRAARPRTPTSGPGGLRGPARAARPRRRPRPPDRGTPRSSAPPRNDHDAPAPDSLRDLAFLDRINEDRRCRPLRRGRQAPPPLRRRLRHPRPARPRRTRTDHDDRPLGPPTARPPDCL